MDGGQQLEFFNLQRPGSVFGRSYARRNKKFQFSFKAKNQYSEIGRRASLASFDISRKTNNISIKEQSLIENQESKETILPLAEKLFSNEMKIFQEDIMPAIEKASDSKKEDRLKRLKESILSSLIALFTISKSPNREAEKSAEQILERIKRLK